MDRVEQIKTIRVSAETIMGCVDFRRGFDDVRNGQPPCFDAYTVDTHGDGNAYKTMTNRLWNYERGRFFARIVPISMPLRVDGKLNPKAVRLFKAASQRGYLP